VNRRNLHYRERNFPTSRHRRSALGHPGLDRITRHFGDLSVAQFDRPEKIRLVIVQWRKQWAGKPRTADYSLQVLSAVLAYAVDPLGRIARNPCEGIKRLYSGDRSEIIWTEADIAQIKKTCSPEIAHAVELAAHTGLREGDLVRLCWTNVGEDAIEISTGKSKFSRDAFIPLWIPRRSPVILTNANHQPWQAGQFASAFVRAKKAAGMADRDLHFHDLRGTAATRFYASGLDLRVIAGIMAWEEDTVGKIIKRYVDRTAATKAIIRQLNNRNND
jgi:integrase